MSDLVGNPEDRFAHVAAQIMLVFWLLQVSKSHVQLTESSICIRKTCPCKLYPFKPHIYIAKLGYAGLFLFFLFFLQNIDCG